MQMTFSSLKSPVVVYFKGNNRSERSEGVKFTQFVAYKQYSQSWFVNIAQVMHVKNVFF